LKNLQPAVSNDRSPQGCPGFFASPVFEGNTMSQTEGFDVITKLTQLDESLQNDSAGELVMALLQKMKIAEEASRSLLAEAYSVDRATISGLIGGFEAGQRVLRYVWEQHHGRLEMAWFYSLPVSEQEPLLGENSNDCPLTYQPLMMTALLAHLHEFDEAELKLLDVAVELILPKPALYRVNCLLAMGVKGSTERAKERLQQRIDENPDDEMAKITLGAALLVSGDEQWRNPLDYVVATSDDMPIRNMAMELIEGGEAVLAM
jgi:hypothetical protein